MSFDSDEEYGHAFTGAYQDGFSEGQKVEKEEADKSMTEKEYYALGRADAEKIIKDKVVVLRQFLNERPDRPVTNEEILYFLGLATMEEVEESRRKEKEIKAWSWACYKKNL